MQITVTVSQWGWDGGVYPGGRHTIDRPSRKLLAAVAAAEASGDLTVKASKDERAKLAKLVEADSDSLKAQEKAVADGSWHRGNHEAFIAQSRHLLADPGLPDDHRARLEAHVQVSEVYLANAGLGHENAVRVALGQPLTEMADG